MMRILLSVAALVMGSFLGPLRAEPLKISITQGQVAPTPIAITALYSPTPSIADMGTKISAIVAADLDHSGLFKSIDSRAFVQDLISLQAAPRFPDWRVINAQILVKGTVSVEPNGRLRVEFRLFDVIGETQMEGLAFGGTQQEWRRIAHKIADAIYKRVTGEDGYFDTKIVYVSQVGPAKKRVKRLAIMDQDGANHQFLTSGQSLVLTPRFAPNLHQITYLDFQTGKPKVWVMNTATKKKELIGNFPGMTFAPRFSPDGRKMVMSFSKDGNTSLYSFDLQSRESKRLTHESVIDTSPSYSADGTQICFNSDRGGRTQIYVMNSDGSNVQRISFGEGSYRTPVWSPRGDLIAFTKITDGSFYIGVMKPDGSGERLLAQGWVVEDPCWAPNGRVLMFTRQDAKGKSKSYSVDLTGYNERQIKTPTDAGGASWSPLIP